ncbi:MAG: HAMP domain-containing sensor histidine kinase [Ruthenibacterium sp.]
MAKQKSISLVTLVMRCVVLCLAAVLVVAALWWLCLIALMNSGAVLPANTAEQQAKQAQRALTENGAFERALVPEMCGYALFDAGGALTQTSLTGAALRDAERYFTAGMNGMSRYHVSAPLRQGTCVLQYKITAVYASKALRAALPGIEPTFLVLLVLFLILSTGGILWHYVRIFKTRLQVLSGAAAQLASGDLQRAFSKSGIREYDAVLDSMRALQSALQKSLREQWSMEHSRIAQTSALAHDLRTPLTVIGGNAQLLAESALTDEQKICVDAMLRSAESAQDYVSAMTEIARAERQSAAAPEKETLDGEKFAACIKRDAEEICCVKQVRLCYTAQATPALTLRARDVRRAVANLVENAAAHSPAGSTVSVHVMWQPPQVVFTVRDEGKGFSEQALSRALELFYTEDAQCGQGGVHRGIGLSFVAAVAAQHDGRVQIKNTPEGHGSVSLSLCAANKETAYSEEDGAGEIPCC